MAMMLHSMDISDFQKPSIDESHLLKNDDSKRTFMEKKDRYVTFF
jgi:hypothetical protein